MTTNKERLVYLNSAYIPQNKAQVSIMDRGFLLGDAVYEVVPVFGGVPFRLGQHLKRLGDSLNAIRMKNPLSENQWTEIVTRIIGQYPTQDQSLYIQVTRGVAASRDHVFPDPVIPTVLVMTSPMDAAKFKQFRAGIAAITLDDIRWRLCRIKATTLLANVLARQQALDEKALEAILIRDGYALEGAASNLFIVKDNLLITPPKGDELLPGITRDLILELAANAGIAYAEQAIAENSLFDADEVWLTSSVREIVPVIEINHRRINGGIVGPLWQRMSTLYEDYKQTLRTHD